ncbi:ImmA/IrrE family metallo-endopeptidase [Stomatohabitans albus]|uniref:ImmA/IrrE family metallo-endopeptidase n=1 Tax=Stomatohabitans albus TaxID=3110766 RepID=UPI00300C069D
MADRIWVLARQEAKRVRNSFLPDDEKGAISLSKLCRYLDIDVQLADLKPGISGFIQKEHPNEQPFIVLNKNEPVLRQRFTLAHELGHYFERKMNNDLEYTFVDSRSSNDYDLHEFYADEFAGELLMPADQIEELRANGRDEIYMAKYFKVTIPAIEKRLERIRLGEEEAASRVTNTPA